MATVRKLSTIRQFSFNYESPNLEHRRKSLRKQFSEDFPDDHKKLGDSSHEIKIAWADPHSPKEEGIIAKKCIKGVKKTPKLIRHSSLEKNSILYTKQELADRLQQALQDRSNTKSNHLNIFLAHNTQDEDLYEPDPEPPPMPKIIPTLLSLEHTTLFSHKKFTKPNPLPSPVISVVDEKDSQAIKDIIIRPSTAAAKRANFQKRATAFNSVIKEGGTSVSRAPLMRSSSAPTRPDHSEKNKPKFLATKRKIKSGKIKTTKETGSDGEDNNNKENPKSKKEMNKFVVINGNDVETMVSLVSPADSEAEEVEIEIKPKSKPTVVITKPKEEGKCVSLRKTVKSVSFQQSSIHAIRSFSASFPARRGSMATALMLGNNGKNQEKRTTNFTTSDDETRPKRRLVRSATEIMPESDEGSLSETCNEKTIEIETPITVGIKVKESTEIEEKKEDEVTVEKIKEQNKDKEKPSFGSEKEKQCWEMYCKMVDKGLNVSYDTILRGMLTPTEYRMRRRESIATVSVPDDATTLQ